jgi:hypothetical protein
VSYGHFIIHNQNDYKLLTKNICGRQSLKEAPLSHASGAHTFGTQTFKRHSMTFDNKIAVFRRFRINFAAVWQGAVKNPAALSAMKMMMPVSPPVISQRCRV